MSWLWLPLLAFGAMFPQDVLGSIMVRAEAQGRAHLAAACDTLQDACGLMSLGALGGSVLTGGTLALTATSAAVIAARLLADYSGTFTGVRLGQRLDRRPA